MSGFRNGRSRPIRRYLEVPPVYDGSVGRLLAIAVLLCGCRQLLGFETVAGNSDGGAGAEAAIDALPDAGSCLTLDSQCIGNTLRTCTAIGELPTDTPCAWGCLTTGMPHCGVLAPAGGAVMPSDLKAGPTPLGDITITTSSDSGLDTVAGTITGSRPAGTGIQAGIDFNVRNSVAIFRFNSLVIDGAGPLQLSGTNALALVSLGDVTIRVPIDATVSCGGGLDIVGGFHGGQGGGDGTGPGGGKHGQGGGDKTGGGGGAGYAALGGDGGVSTQGGAAGAAGGVYGDDVITVLFGGSGGGGVNNGGTAMHGGSGGGAVQIVANGTIHIEVGGINVGGCGGNAAGQGGGAGGGAGGTILLEAPSILVDPAAFLAANGGGGGGDGTNLFAENGQPSSTPAQGVAGQNGGDGGAGGAGLNLIGTAGKDALEGGGGGGAVGRIRIETLATQLTIDSAAVVSPALGTIATKTATANVQ
jgi:hypothetical protein